MELHLLTWGNCWKSMSHHGHWDQHPRTYSASRETTWKPTVTDRLVPVPQNYGISSQIIFGQLGVWQSSNDDWKHICSKMYISINYVDINIYPLTMECNAPLSMFIWKGRNIKWQYYYYYYFYINLVADSHVKDPRRFPINVNFTVVSFVKSTCKERNGTIRYF